MSGTESPHLKVLLAATEHSGPTRADLQRRAAVLACVGVVAGLVVFWAAGGVRMGPRPLALVLATTIAMAVAAALVAGVTLRRGRTMLGPSRPALLGATVGGAAGMLYWKIAISELFEGMTAPWDGRPGFRCLYLTLGMAVIPLLTTLVARRRTDVCHPFTGGASIGATIGFFALVGTDLWCPVAHLPHLFLGHVLPVAILSIVGGCLGHFILDPAR